MQIFNLLKLFLPDVLELFEYILNINDHDFMKISKSWPAPIKTKMAKMRFEAKLLAEFPDEEEII